MNRKKEEPRPVRESTVRMRRYTRWSITALGCLVWMSGLDAMAQDNGASGAAASQQSGALGSTSQNSSSTQTELVRPLTSNLTISAEKLVRLMDSEPQVIVELKQMLADQMQQAGVYIQADDISDEAMFRYTTQSAAFRAQAAQLLHARGYISDDDLEESTDLAMQAASGELTANGILPTELLSADLLTKQSGNDLLPGNGSTLQPGRTSMMRLPAQQRSPSVENAQKPNALRVLHEPTPYNLQSLRDLYTQVPSEGQTLKRFGSDVFLRRGTETTSLQSATQGMDRTAAPSASMAQGAALGSMSGLAAGMGIMPEAALPTSAVQDRPVGPDYVLGPGDGLSIALWGGVSQTMTRTVDSSGRVILPEAGPLMVADLKISQAQDLIERTLAPQFRDVHAALTLSRLRTIRIYVVGDVQRPGAVDISAQATPLYALYAAGGPTATGSLRTLRHMRGSTLVSEVDLYDFLLHGVHTTTDALEEGDTILVPAVGAQVGISGAVKRPAIYELKRGCKALRTARRCRRNAGNRSVEPYYDRTSCGQQSSGNRDRWGGDSKCRRSRESN